MNMQTATASQLDQLKEFTTVVAERLADGIRNFAADIKLEQIIETGLQWLYTT
jgi:hypothetical protein